MIHVRTFTTALGRCTADAGAKPYDLLFCGTDEFALPSLKRLAERRDLCRSVQVLVPQAEPSRWRRVRREIDTPPVKTYAEDNKFQCHVVPEDGINAMSLPAPFNQPSSSNLLVAASFGHLIPPSILQHFPPHQALNVHPSLLPRYRGAAPIQWAIANGDHESGITIQTLGHRFDTGAILAQSQHALTQNEDFYGLRALLKDKAADLLLDTVENLEARATDARSQDHSARQPRAPKLVRDLTLIDWAKDTAVELERKHRAFGYLFPLHTYLTVAVAAKSGFTEKRCGVQLHSVQVRSEMPPGVADVLATSPPGTALYDADSSSFLCRCAGPSRSSVLQILALQRDARKLLMARSWRAGNTNRQGGFTVVRFYT